MAVKSDARMEIRLPKELKHEVEEYAKRNHTRISALVIRLLTALIDADKKIQNPEDAEQI